MLYEVMLKQLIQHNKQQDRAVAGLEARVGQADGRVRQRVEAAGAVGGRGHDLPPPRPQAAPAEETRHRGRRDPLAARHVVGIDPRARAQEVADEEAAERLRAKEYYRYVDSVTREPEQGRS